MALNLDLGGAGAFAALVLGLLGGMLVLRPHRGAPVRVARVPVALAPALTLGCPIERAEWRWWRAILRRPQHSPCREMWDRPWRPAQLRRHCAHWHFDWLADEQNAFEAEHGPVGRMWTAAEAARWKPHQDQCVTCRDGLATQYPRTPAMAAGLNDHLWTCEEIAALLD